MNLPRRPGDVVAVYANNDKARTNPGWNPAYGLDQMMETAWNWELAMGRKAGKQKPVEIRPVSDYY